MGRMPRGSELRQLRKDIRHLWIHEERLLYPKALREAAFLAQRAGVIKENEVPRLPVGVGKVVRHQLAGVVDGAGMLTAQREQLAARQRRAAARGTGKGKVHLHALQIERKAVCTVTAHRAFQQRAQRAAGNGSADEQHRALGGKGERTIERQAPRAERAGKAREKGQPVSGTRRVKVRQHAAVPVRAALVHNGAAQGVRTRQRERAAVDESHQSAVRRLRRARARKAAALIDGIGDVDERKLRRPVEPRERGGRDGKMYGQKKSPLVQRGTNAYNKQAGALRPAIPYATREFDMLSLLCPQWVFDDHTAVTPAFLREHGVRLLLCDLDYTLAPKSQREPDEALRQWIGALRGAGITVAILSNNRSPARVERFCKPLGIGYVGHAGKPAVRGFREAMARYGVRADETAMLGDKLLTDVLGARRSGVLALMVEPKGGPRGAWNRALHAMQQPFKAASAHDERAGSKNL